jgi:hypothetical protein
MSLFFLPYCGVTAYMYTYTYKTTGVLQGWVEYYIHCFYFLWRYNHYFYQANTKCLSVYMTHEQVISVTQIIRSPVYLMSYRIWRPRTGKRSTARGADPNRKSCDDFITDHVGSRVTAQIILRFAIHVSMAGRRWTTAISHKQPASLQSCAGTVRNSFLLARWKGCVSDLLLCGSFASAFQVVIFISVNCKNVVTVDLVICLVREKCAWISLSNSGSYLNYAWCA